uniref:Uncharacterized protein n=1 Tax=Timema douglasi TaxID=61478 RepID=A0A7R8VCM1_TIMDO|nr:unnamed protein product [Timema douglasi]
MTLGKYQDIQYNFQRDNTYDCAIPGLPFVQIVSVFAYFKGNAEIREDFSRRRGGKNHVQHSMATDSFVERSSFFNDNGTKKRNRKRRNNTGGDSKDWSLRGRYLQAADALSRAPVESNKSDMANGHPLSGRVENILFHTFFPTSLSLTGGSNGWLRHKRQIQPHNN